MAVGLAGLGLIGLVQLGGTHITRVFFSLLAVGVGGAMALSFARNQKRATRLEWAAGGLVLAGVVWLFMPTTGGLSLWRAYGLLNQIEDLPAGDVAQYSATAGARQELSREFPGFEPEVVAAERSWVRRTANQIEEEANGQLSSDPTQATALLKQAHANLSQPPLRQHYGLVEDQLRGARRRALVARLKAAEDQLDALLRDKKFVAVTDEARRLASELEDEATELHFADAVTRSLLERRSRAAVARLDQAREETAELLKKDRFRAVAGLGKKTGEELRAEAAAVGLAKELQAFQDSCAAFGVLADAAGKPDPE
jgi:hypothetical protein